MAAHGPPLAADRARTSGARAVTRGESDPPAAVGQVRGEHRHAPAAAGGAESPPLAGEGDHDSRSPCSGTGEAAGHDAPQPRKARSSRSRSAASPLRRRARGPRRERSRGARAPRAGGRRARGGDARGASRGRRLRRERRPPARAPPAATRGGRLQLRAGGQVGVAHEVLVDAAGALAAFPDRPHHQRLAAARVAAGEDAGHAASCSSRRRRRCCARRVLRPSSVIGPLSRGRGSRAPAAPGRRRARTRCRGSPSSAGGRCRPAPTPGARRASFFTLPFSPEKRLVLMLQSRIDALLVRAARCAGSSASTATACRRVRASGGCGSSSNWCTETRALAVRRAEAVGAGVAAAEDDDALARRA